MNRKKKKAAQSLLLSAVLVGINIMDSSPILAEENILSWDGITELSASDIYFRAETSQAELEVEEVYVEEGGILQEGAEVIKITEKSYQEALDYYEAAILRAEAALTDAELEHEKSTLETEHELELARAKSEQADSVRSRSLKELQDTIEEHEEISEKIDTVTTELEEGISDGSYDSQNSGGSTGGSSQSAGSGSGGNSEKSSGNSGNESGSMEKTMDEASSRDEFQAEEKEDDFSDGSSDEGEQQETEDSFPEKDLQENVENTEEEIWQELETGRQKLADLKEKRDTLSEALNEKNQRYTQVIQQIYQNLELDLSDVCGAGELIWGLVSSVEQMTFTVAEAMETIFTEEETAGITEMADHWEYTAEVPEEQIFTAAEVPQAEQASEPGGTEESGENVTGEEPSPEISDSVSEENAVSQEAAEPAGNPSGEGDNSAELASLQARIAALEAENTALKSELLQAIEEEERILEEWEERLRKPETENGEEIEEDQNPEKGEQTEEGQTPEESGENQNTERGQDNTGNQESQETNSSEKSGEMDGSGSSEGTGSSRGSGSSESAGGSENAGPSGSQGSAGGSGSMPSGGSIAEAAGASGAKTGSGSQNSAESSLFGDTYDLTDIKNLLEKTPSSTEEAEDLLDFDILVMFLEHMGEILSREKINSFLPARKRSGVRNIDTHIKSIRKALGEQELIQ